jgi:hypothetical protein
MEGKVRFRFLLIPFAFAITLAAQENDAKLQIHGFISQGYLKSTDNNFLVQSKNGSFEFNEAAVTFSSQVSPKLRIGAQLFSRDFGAEGNNIVNLDWAYGDFRWKDGLGFRFGKIKSPYGFYNQGRDVDVLRTAILLPQSVYQEDIRDFILAYQGGSVYGGFSIPKMRSIGSFDYELIYGTISIPDPNSGYWRWVFSDLAEYIVKQMPPGTSSTIKNPSVVGRYVTGGMLTWNTPIPGLRLGASNFIGKLKAHTKLDLVIPTDLSLINPIFQGLLLPNILNMNINIDVDIKKYNALSAEFNWNNLTLTSEYHSQNYSIDVSGIKVNYGGDGYYGQATYRLSRWLELGTYYSESIPWPDDKKGKQLYKRNLPEYFAWQKDASLTVRFDMTKNWILKIEGHAIKGCGLVRIMDNPDGTKENWKLFAVKTSYQF